MTEQEGSNRENDSERGQGNVAQGRDASNQGDSGPRLPADQVWPERSERRRKPRLVREHPIAALVVAVIVAVITAVATITAAVITKAPASVPGGPLYSGDDSAFCGDVTYPDHTDVTVGKKFVKKWLLCNTGSVRWTGRFLVPSSDDIGSCEFPVRIRVPDTSPGQKALVTVTVIPLAPGRCYVPWKMVNSNDQFCFPADKGVWFDVVARKAS